jgi:hypothetical protein
MRSGNPPSPDAAFLGAEGFMAAEGRASSVMAPHLALLAAAALGCVLGGAAAQAQGTLQARYRASISGLPVGTGSWYVSIGDDQYVVGANGSTSGLARLFSNGSGQAGATGSIANGRLATTTYAMTINQDNSIDQINMTFADGALKQVTPPLVPGPDRVPMTEAHYRGVADPLTAGLVRVAGTGNPVSPAACQGTAAIFTGRMRFELRRAFKRMESVRADKGYQGPVVVCALYFTAIAGHNPGRTWIKYATQLKDMEVSLAPIANTRVLAPFRISIPTPFGLAELQATEFVSVATPGRPTAANAKTQ